jgi:23S rRNA (uracil1939-C5)-methyltransferase/tRNA (uracil-5-)-methyltransferase
MRNRKFNATPFGYHEEIELEISTLTNRGLGLGRVALPGETGPAPAPVPEPGAGPDQAPSSGWVVMVPFTLPGERVRARIFRNHKNYSEADPVDILTPSPHRVAPLCPLFGRCGGCQYQHLAYSEQLAWKRRQVAELLEHMAGLSFPVDPVVASPREFGYRSKITPHFEPGEPPFPIGFLRQGTRHDLVDVPRCEIATAGINERLAALRQGVREKAAAGGFARGATLLLREAGGAVVTDYDAVITERIVLPRPGLSLALRFLARDFFQNNPFILPEFVAHVRDEASSGGARFLVDAYCGSGLFALGSAAAFERVAGVEISATSVNFARENAAANGISNAAFLAGDAAAIFSGLEFPPGETAVVVDPPRKGCDEGFLRQLFAFGPRTVVYVSCDPATQMRDLRHFLGAGYRPTRVRPFDLFPQTRHLECVITLQKGAGQDGAATRQPACLPPVSPSC